MSKLNIQQLEEEIGNNISTDITISENTNSDIQVAVDPNIIYNKLNTLVETGDKLLKTAEYLVSTEPDADNIASTASLITSVKDVIKEFTVLHRDRMRFEQQKELEKLKFKQKEKLLKMKLNSGNKTTNTSSVETMEFSQEQIIEQIIEMEN